MMKVRTKYGIKYGDIMYDGGQEIDITEEQYAELKEHVVEVGYVSEVFPPDEEKEQPKRTGRRRKKD